MNYLSLLIYSLYIYHLIILLRYLYTLSNLVNSQISHLNGFNILTHLYLLDKILIISKNYKYIYNRLILLHNSLLHSKNSLKYFLNSNNNLFMIT